ncbi:MAG: SANT/Myb-like DNA-binding domain-containing protein [Desulfomonilaceae bacterium]
MQTADGLPKKVLDQRLAELVKKHGRKWKKIALILTEEGYRNKNDDQFSPWAIQKRCDRRPGRHIPIRAFVPHASPILDVIDEIFVPEEDMPFQVKMAQMMVLGVFLERIGEYFQRMALENVCDRFSEQGFYWFAWNVLNDPSAREKFMPTDFFAPLKSIKSTVRSVIADLSTLPRGLKDLGRAEFPILLKRGDLNAVWLALLDKIFDDGIMSHYGYFKNANAELPPRRRGNKGSRKDKVHRKFLGSTVDSVLRNLFDEHKKKLGIRASRMLDTILWHWFGCPRLSYQSGESHQTATPRKRRQKPRS